MNINISCEFSVIAPELKKKEEKQKQSDNWSKKQVNRLNSG